MKIHLECRICGKGIEIFDPDVFAMEGDFIICENCGTIHIIEKGIEKTTGAKRAFYQLKIAPPADQE